MAYRARYADAYLPHGITTVRDVGSTEEDLAVLSSWMTPAAGTPDFFPSGGALVSPEEGRTTFPGHVVVADPEDARRKVRAYHERGYRHLKLYWRLREPEFRAALEEARHLGMRVTGHVDFHVLGMDRALDLGLRGFEHVHTVGVSALTDAEYRQFWARDVPAAFGARRNGLFHLAILEVYNQLGPAHPEALRLIERLAETGSMVSTTLHIFAQQVGAAPFRLSSGTSFDDIEGLTDAQRGRAAEGYRLLAAYVRRIHEAGVRLTLGPDWMEPGRTALSEMLLLHDAGIPMADVLRIGTLNGALALGLEDRGAVEAGMLADLVVFHEGPLEDARGLFGPKTVVKRGRVVAAGTGSAPIPPEAGRESTPRDAEDHPWEKPAAVAAHLNTGGKRRQVPTQSHGLAIELSCGLGMGRRAARRKPDGPAALGHPVFENRSTSPYVAPASDRRALPGEPGDRRRRAPR